MDPYYGPFSVSIPTVLEEGGFLASYLIRWLSKEQQLVNWINSDELEHLFEDGIG
jgi:hypothetical protein